jgi:tetratricopeptide (TPR) repeat protein
MMAPRQKPSSEGAVRLAFALLLPVWIGCTAQSSISNHYLTAEKLWSEKNYRAAVAEFDRVVKESPESAIGLQALWRASMTQALFLNEPQKALKGFELFIQRAANSELAPQALLEMGEILFSRLNQYGRAIEHYEKLIESPRFREEDRALFHYRVARGHFHLHRIRKSIEWYERILVRFPRSSWIPRAMADLGSAWYALGDHDRSAFPKALKIFQELKNRTQGRQHRIYVEAVFNEASTLEELDKLEEAHDLFKTIENDYPAPNVIRIRMVRLSERMKKKRK